MNPAGPVTSEAFEWAMDILTKVRIYAGDHNHELSREYERKLHEMVADHCHFWGDFYGPADTVFLARVLAHRYMDRQGYNEEHLHAAWERFVK